MRRNEYLLLVCFLRQPHAQTRPAVAKEIGGAHGLGLFEQIGCEAGVFLRD